MTPEVSKNIRRQTNLLNESTEYLAKRDELRLAEIASMRQRERVPTVTAGRLSDARCESARQTAETAGRVPRAGGRPWSCASADVHIPPTTQ